MCHTRGPGSRFLVTLALSSSAVVACRGGGGEGQGGTAQGTLGCATVGRQPSTADSSVSTENVRAGRNYECVLRAQSPPIHVELVADTSANRISRIVLRRAFETSPFQTLTEGQSEAPYRGADFFLGRDLDGDGYLDLLLLSDWGVTGNNYYHVWRWNAPASRFVFDSALSAIASPTPVAGQPCVASRSTGGDAGRLYDAATLCFQHGKWLQTSSETQRWDRRARAYVHTVRERRGDSVVVTRVDTVRDSTGR
jgi:hypothetical protein